MTLSRRRFLTIAAAAAFCPPGRAAAVTWRGFAMGAEVGVTLSLPPGEAEPLFREIEAELRHLERLFSLYDPASRLSELNRTGMLAPAPAEMRELLELCGRLHHATGGRFDPTVQPLWQAAAAREDLGKARAAVGWERVRLSQDAVRLGAGQALTLNGIAQGYATDRVTALLARAGLDKVLVNIGEYSGLGGPWHLGVADPVHGLVAERTLHDGAIATSSPGALQFGDGLSHILDPRGGDLTRAHWSTVSVEADTAAIADGVSTALCLTNRDEMGEILRELPEVRRVTLVTHNGDISVQRRA